MTLAKELIFTGGFTKTLTHGILVVQRGLLCDSLFLSLLSGRRVGGQAALEMGLVNRGVEQNQTGDAAYREALSLAREILPQVRTHTLLHSATAQILMHPCTSGQGTCSLTSSLLPPPPNPPFFSTTPSLLPVLLLSSATFPSLSFSLSPGLCRSVFLSLRFRCPQSAAGPEWQSSGENGPQIAQHIRVLVWIE